MSARKLFTIPILKEEKVSFILSIIGIIILPMILVVINCVKGDDIVTLGQLLLILFLPLFIVGLALGAASLEWFNVYEDRIEAVCLYKIKNTVYFKDVVFVEQTKIYVFVKGKPRDFYIFNDGRKNNNSIINTNSCHNAKKFNLRIYKNPKIDELISHQHFETREMETTQY